MERDERIPLYVAHGRAHVYEVEGKPVSCQNHEKFAQKEAVVKVLRTKHHICGVLSGTLPQVAQQSNFLGVPLILLPEEVYVLLTERLAYLVDDAAAHRAATQAEVEAYLRQREALSLAQQAQHLEAVREKQALLATRLGRSIEAPAVLPHAIRIDTSTRGPWHAPKRIFETYEGAVQAGLIARGDQSRQRMFHDLWKRGHFLGGGMRFGGDLLVYPGDSLRYHSHFTATELATIDTLFSPLALVAQGRLATAVKKAHLLCAADEKGEMQYLTLTWAGF